MNRLPLSAIVFVVIGGISVVVQARISALTVRARAVHRINTLLHPHECSLMIPCEIMVVVIAGFVIIGPTWLSCTGKPVEKNQCDPHILPDSS